MQLKLVWDEAKRKANLTKHGLDFADAAEVLLSNYRFDVQVVRKGEIREQSFAYVFSRLHVLTVIHLARDGATRVISYRPASETETENYYDWIGSQKHDT